jgi:hypothetical protein
MFLLRRKVIRPLKLAHLWNIAPIQAKTFGTFAENAQNGRVDHESASYG